MSCSENKNPLQRVGTSQQQRLLAALKSSYIRIDEREYADWIVFAEAFAEYLNYYNLTNQVDGNWKPFFEKDVSAILGSMAIQNIDAYRQAVTERFNIVRSDDHADTVLKKTLGALFSCIFTLCKALDEYADKIPGEVALKQTLQNLITIKLQPVLQRLLSYYKGGYDLTLIKEENITGWKVLNKPVAKAESIITEGLSSLWIKGGGTWSAYYAAITSDPSVYGNAGWNVYRKISHAANHNLFSGAFDQFLMVYARIVKEAEQQLLKSLTDWDSHPAHYTLFLAFLKLFRYSQDHINTLTQRHLDFYYKEVLQLKPKPAVANQAHILVELAKQTEEYLLKQGTSFKAGKDSAGKEIIYTLDQDTLFNKGKVASLMTLYKGSSTDNIGTVNNNGRLFASPVTNSADGLGAELKTDNKEWQPYVNKTYTDGSLSSINMPKAEIGFAVASHYLSLSEGKRTVNIKLVTASGSAAFPSSLAIDCYLTTEKGWYQAVSPTFTSGQTSETTPASCKMISFTIPGDAPAITDYNMAVHGGVLDCTLPVVKVYLKNENNAAYTYNDLKGITLQKIEVEVKVGADTYNQDGLKQLTLAGDSGPIDPSKPFQPFGVQPKKGSSFIIGSKEIFTKKGAKIKLNAEWDGLPASPYDIDHSPEDPENDDYYPYSKMRFRMSGKWDKKSASDTDADIIPFNDTNATVVFPSAYMSLPDGVIVNYADTYDAYSNKSNAGFIKLSLNGSFGQDSYLSDLTDYLIKKANQTLPSGATQPVAPYVPTLRSLYLSYTAATINTVTSTSKQDFNNRSVRFFHLFPFGSAEQHTVISGNTSINLLPQFSHTENGVVKEHAGEWYIGLQNIVAGQGVQVLFQVLEGTTNPLLDKPDEHVSWSYLGNNQWKLFDDQHIVDYTSQLVSSGIISFIIPADATSANTLLPTGYVWLKATVNEMAEAVCKLISVDAQAAVVTLADNNNAADLLNTALAAGTISKLKEPVSAIKKISQPYASFGGKPVEASESFYVRVSERLRHKNRAITIWDYEHLILEAFPEIHLVKCLNHTKYEGSSYNEVLPGHVTIITVPDLTNRNDTNPLRPYTNQNTLEAIEAFIKKKISCHVKLHVRQPQFEEVRMDFKLKLISGLEFNYYKKLLQQEITEFLSPWAFGRSADITFGGKVHKSVLINFIEERSYVDYITDVKMYHRKEDGGTESSDTDIITASTAKSILVSAAASKHAIAEITEAAAATVAEDCTDEWNAAKS